MKDKCPYCHKLVEVAGYGEKKCPRCGEGLFITPNENDKDIIHLVVDLKIAGFPLRGDVFIDTKNVPEILSSTFALEKLSPLLSNMLQSLFSQK